MHYYSGGYVPFNPNFVISTIKTKSSVSQTFSDVIDIVKNILFRGVPTKPSIFLQECLGKPISERIKYTYGTKKNKWETIIKTGENHAPALAIYEKLCETNPDIASIVLPECLFGDMILSNTEAKERADFYIPSHKIEIEVDGRQHTKSRQTDIIRDNRLKEAGVELIERMSSDEIYKSLDDKINRIINIVDEYSTEDLFVSNVDNTSQLYMYVFRFQILILELLQKGVLKIGEDVFELSLADTENESFVENAFLIAYEDIKLWISNLFILLNEKLSFPEIKFTKKSDCIIDIDIYNRYDQDILFSDKIIFIRNDYFLYDFNSFGNSSCYCQCKNYNFIRTNNLRFENVDKTNDSHCEALTFFLRNLFLGKNAEFRPNQIDIISKGLKSSCGVIGLLPTGSGKSVCYQLIGMLTAGTTLIVSPLKLLMKDQCENLSSRNQIKNAIYINSDNHEHQSAFVHNQAKFVYVAPERFFTIGFKDMFSKVAKSIVHLVIDEVHCLSEWGHDFRTSYLLILSFIRENLKIDSLLLTGTSATASPHVIDDIRIEFNKIKSEVPIVRSSSVKRKELKFKVIIFREESNRLPYIREIVSKRIQSKEKTLIFAPRKNPDVNDIISHLSYYNIKSGEYTSKTLSDNDEQREKVPDKKTKEEHFEEFKDGRSLVMTATKAFGMGVDIPDIRQTIHFSLSSSVESLYQEIGRAGRDGKDSECTVLLHLSPDIERDINNLFNPLTEKYFVGRIAGDTKTYGDLSPQLYFMSNNSSHPEYFTDFIIETYKFLLHRKDNNFTLKSAFDTLNNSLHLTDDKKFHKVIKGQNSATYTERFTHEVHTIKGTPDKIEPKYDTFLQFFEKALYRLYILGVINLWNIQYKNLPEDRIYTDVKLNDFNQEQCIKMLESHINKYEDYTFVPEEGKGKIFRQILLAFCKWDNDHFLKYRKDSLYTLYNFLSTFKNSEDFAQRIEYYFVDNPEVTDIIEKRSDFDVDKVFNCLKTDSSALRDQLYRYMEGNRFNISLFFMFGMVSIKNNEFTPANKTTLKKALDQIIFGDITKAERVLSKSIDFFKKNKKQLIAFLEFIHDHYKDSFDIFYSCKSEKVKKHLKEITEYVNDKKVLLSLTKLKEAMGGLK